MNLFDNPLIQKIKQAIEADSKKMLIAIAGVCVILAYADYALLIQWQIRGLNTLQPKVEQLKRDLEGVRKDLARMQDVKNRGIATKVNAKTKEIVSEEQVTSVLQDISRMANKNLVKITQMRPSNEPSGLQDKAGFSSLSITLDLTGEYHHLGHFINDLENANIFLALKSLKISTQGSDYLNQRANVVVQTYVKK